MDKNSFMIFAFFVVAIAVIIILLFINTRNSNMKRSIEELNVRFNAIKTIPLAFKLTKAQAMAKRNEETAEEVRKYYEKYEEAQKHIDQLQELLNGVEDAVSSRKYSDAIEALKVIEETIVDCEEEVKEIDLFLEEFSKEEARQREFSNGLKEKYRDLKLTITENSNLYSVAYEGLEIKFEQCEELFSSSEEWMYANEFDKAQDDLEVIKEKIDDIEICAKEIPDLIKDIRGVLPVMMDEAKRQYALSRQRGIYLEHLGIDKKLSDLANELNSMIKVLMDGDVENLREKVDDNKEVLNTIMDSLKEEERSYDVSKEIMDKVNSNILDIEKLSNYVEVAYNKDSERFGLDDLKEFVKEEENIISLFKKNAVDINMEISSNMKPCSKLYLDAMSLYNRTDDNKKSLYHYKVIIDKSTSDEERAISQLMKLQVVVNEVEVKVKEYHLPTIASSYKDDLAKSREYIAEIESLLKGIPLDINTLNSVLDEAIDFIYKFYNNVNNVVGMAIMVENAIVFGNKYRSTYPEIDAELSKAEFSYLNGEYTKALTIAITCMERLFPNTVDEKILENA